jgi:DNA-binding NtrC family response regulator
MCREKSRRPRVLLVEDERLIRWAVAQTLDAAGVTVAEASDARSARVALQAAAPAFDVALVDVHLPDGNGLELMSTILRLWPGTPVILMTAFGTRELQEEARALGALGVVNKPFDLDAMTALVLGAADTSR